MSVYKYFADNDPSGAETIINSFGYEVTDKRDLGQSLNELVLQVGEPALKKIMLKHPDRDIILEYNSLEKNSDCNCGNCKKTRTQDSFLNFNGNEKIKEAKPDTLAHQTNVILVVATLFIVTALIYKNN